MMNEVAYKLKFNYGNLAIELDGDKDFIKDEISFLLSEVHKLQTPKPEIQNNSTTINPENNVNASGDVEIEIVDGEGTNCQSQASTSNIPKVPHIKEFLANYKTNIGQKNALLLAYYVNNVLNKEFFEEQEIINLWKISGLKPMARIWQAILDGKNNRGYYDVAEKGKGKISLNGIYTVENELLIKK